MNQKSNEVEKFFDGLPKADDKEADIFSDKKEEEKKPAPEGSTPVEPKIPAKDAEGGEDNEPRRNRRHRRLEEALEKERQSNIELNRFIRENIGSKNASASQPSSSDMPPEWVALYGDTPEAQKAWKVQEKMLQSYTARAKAEAITEIEERRSKERDEQRQFESFIDTQLENLEDAHDVDLTSDAPAARKARREFLEMVTSLSPKDEDGNITGYADFGSTFDLYKKTKTQTDAKPDETVNKAKEIAGRSMQQSTQGATQGEQKITPGFRGWHKDYNL